MSKEMKKFRFEIQNCITVDVIDVNKESARMSLIENEDLYQKELSKDNVYISEGIEVENE